MDLVSSVELIDDRPLVGSRRSNPATWLKVFDEIRRLFAETEDARNRNLTVSQFSFNTDSGGRCNKCDGTGRVEIDMQFLADVSMTCPDCSGTRYLPHILEVQWRARTIADVLAMTAAEAFLFFRGQPKIQKRLRSLKDVGLDYLTLGQPLATLSGGESQRLKLAACLASSSRTGSLLLMNEPTTGLHPADVARLLECFDGLLSVGHSLVVIEHNLDVIRHADHVIDMGPEAGPDGGRVVATGSVAEIVACSESITGQYLRKSVPTE
jgi:excinuclease ABC subunit A